MKYLSTAAGLSEDTRYRYWLQRVLPEGNGIVLFVGLNPSTADALNDDPTIRKAVGFAQRWGFRTVWMGNLHAWRATDPRQLGVVEDPIGPENRDWLVGMVQQATLVVAAWGSHRLHGTASTLAGWILSQEKTLCLGQNQDGTPKHILYLPYTTSLRHERWISDE